MPNRPRPAGPLKPEDLTFEEARAILERVSEEAKQELARVSRAPEVLAYLAGHQDGGVRALVAANAATPKDIDLQLASDQLAEVRVELARKIGRLLPGLSGPDADRLREGTLKVIAKLASDVLPRVRQIVAEEIKSSRVIPKAIVEILAHDAEIAVAAPVLEYSPLLSDEDLLEIIATSQVEGVLAAIASRNGLSTNVSDAVVATLDIPAITALLANQSAKIRSETLDQIAESARDVEAWHKPLVLRPELSVRAIRRISGFVASSLLEILSVQHRLDDETRHQITLRVRDRLAHETPPAAEPDLRERTRAVVSRAASDGVLDDNFVLDAIRMDNRLRTMFAIAALGNVSEALVERIMRSGSAQIITALAWHAGLQMRTAFALQKSVARLGPSELLPARNGIDYPMTERQMISQLELMGIKHAE